MRTAVLLLPLLLIGTGAAYAQDSDRDGPPPPPGEQRGEPPRGRMDLFASPMGEPFRGMGDKSGEQLWFEGADSDHDGRLTRAEMEQDAVRFFALLDVGHDGEIDPADIDRYETLLFPEMRGRPFEGGGRGAGGGGPGGGGPGGGGPGGDGDGPMMRRGGGEGNRAPGSVDRGKRRAPAGDGMRQGAGRFAYLDLPEPVTAADSSFNRGVSLREFKDAAQQRFALLDMDHDGVLTLKELEPLRPKRNRRGGGRPDQGRQDVSR